MGKIKHKVLTQETFNMYGRFVSEVYMDIEDIPGLSKISVERVDFDRFVNSLVLLLTNSQNPQALYHLERTNHDRNLIINRY